jgi:hypothetical protein
MNYPVNFLSELSKERGKSRSLLSDASALKPKKDSIRKLLKTNLADTSFKSTYNKEISSILNRTFLRGNSSNHKSQTKVVDWGTLTDKVVNLSNSRLEPSSGVQAQRLLQIRLRDKIGLDKRADISAMVGGSSPLQMQAGTSTNEPGDRFAFFKPLKIKETKVATVTRESKQRGRLQQEIELKECVYRKEENAAKLRKILSGFGEGKRM